MVQNFKFEALDRLPPQNIEAEEAILGGILLDPEALGRVMELLQPDAFYISAHRTLYKAALSLQTQGQPTDLMTLTAWLKDHDQLEKIGGQTRLAQLVDRTLSAANIDQYASLVMDKYTRRKLIQAGGEISQLGYETSAPLAEVLDQSEQKLFGITQDRPQAGLTATADILTETFSDIEQRSLGMVLPGVACGFYDLDAMTQGFQRSDLIIAAGRPAMGKTSFVLNIARNIAVMEKLPVAIFSLEMSKAQLVYRLLSSEVQIESGRLRAGRIAQHEWEALGYGISALSQLPVFIDDTPNISVTEMRSKARRLQAEQGGALGLILIDYLQLMEGGGDNRVQELSKITRALKGLGRELNVPIIALSQLSRGVESRTNKRPMMSDLRECVTGETRVVLADGRRVPIQALVGTTPQVMSLDATGRLVRAQTDLVWRVGEKPVYRINLASGKVIRATAQHRLLGVSGWQRVETLAVGQRLATARSIPDSTSPSSWPDLGGSFLGDLIGGGRDWQGPPLRDITAAAAHLGLARLTAEQGINCTVERYGGGENWPQLLSSGHDHRWHPAGGKLGLREFSRREEVAADIGWDEIQSIEFTGEETVYDLTVPSTGSWLADGIVSHNSGSIEQDADLIMMLYREEYYDPDTPDRGITEIIVAKHRNGPTGTIKLLFEPEFTRFRNLAGG